jgi:hypothetical protein
MVALKAVLSVRHEFDAKSTAASGVNAGSAVRSTDFCRYFATSFSKYDLKNAI